MTPLRRRALRAWDHWQAAAGPWARWASCSTLTGPGVDELDPLHPRPGRDAGADRLAGSLAARLVRDGCATLLVLDLPPAVGVRIAALLATQGLCAPVLRVDRWPYAEAVLTVPPLLGALLSGADGLSGRVAGPHVAVVLDGERGTPLPVRPRGDRRADNRWSLLGDELPDGASLRDGRLVRVLDVRTPAHPLLPPLSAPVYTAYADAGLAVLCTVREPRDRPS